MAATAEQVQRVKAAIFKACQELEAAAGNVSDRYIANNMHEASRELMAAAKAAELWR